MTLPRTDLLTSSHWGTYRVVREAGRVAALLPFETDPDPSPIGPGAIELLDSPLRIKRPAARKSWLDHGPEAQAQGTARGEDSFVELSWDEAERLIAEEVTRVRARHGNSAIFAGSYGWASAGRFHHAQSQLKRFLNCNGGFTSSRNTYSYAAAEVIIPHVLGDFKTYLDSTTSWEVIAEHCELMVTFGGVPLKNGQISQGGTGAHNQRTSMAAARHAGTEFINISPCRHDLEDARPAEWLALRPGTDTALLLGLAFVLLEEGLCDDAFLARYTEGFDKFADYLKGTPDGVEKSADWASAICALDAEDIRALARKMAAKRTMISLAWSLTRQDHGEQPFWAGVALAAMLGQIGLPGGGFAFGYSAMNHMGMTRHPMSYASFPQGDNPVKDFIPVARVTEMLERPGESFTYDGEEGTYPDIRLVWWAGGNPFHHHQDLNRLRRAWQRPETVIVQEWCWNSLARHADLVLPCTTSLERQDIALTSRDRFQVVMDQAIDPVGEARDDHDILRSIAARLGTEQAFTEGRDKTQWLQWLYESSRERAASHQINFPDWNDFQFRGWFEIARPDKPCVMLEAFRKDPTTHPLRTPSGRIEIFSNTVAQMRYEDCPGHPVWHAPEEWLGAASEDELHLITNQPRNKLHSQLDPGPVSLADRIRGREPVRMHPEDAARRGLSDGQIVRLWNARGACHAGLILDDAVRRGVVLMATGAWFVPQDGMCLQGNPNVLTPDRGTSSLAQGPAANSCLVRVEAAPEAEREPFKQPLPHIIRASGAEPTG